MGWDIGIFVMAHVFFTYFLFLSVLTVSHFWVKWMSCTLEMPLKRFIWLVVFNIPSLPSLKHPKTEMAHDGATIVILPRDPNDVTFHTPKPPWPECWVSPWRILVGTFFRAILLEGTCNNYLDWFVKWNQETWPTQKTNEIWQWKFPAATCWNHRFGVPHGQPYLLTAGQAFGMSGFPVTPTPTEPQRVPSHSRSNLTQMMTNGVCIPVDTYLEVQIKHVVDW